MPALLIDFDEIISDKHDKLKKIIPEVPEHTKNFSPGLIVIIPEKTLQNLSQLSYGKDRVEYLNKDEFIHSIKEVFFVFYNSKKELCILPEKCIEHLDNVLQALQTGFSQKTTLWLTIPIDDQYFTSALRICVDKGFNSPYVTENTPMTTIPASIPPSIALSRQNIPREAQNSKMVINKVIHAIKLYKDNNGCQMVAKLSPRAVHFLRKASDMGIVVSKNGKKSQKELTGELFVENVTTNKGKTIYVIDINEGSVESGENEDVDVAPTRYNFHSHPRQAYVRHSVTKAWPSSTDYLGYKKLGENTIFHCVAAIEGVYIMSFSPYWGTKLSKISDNFVENQFDINHREPYSPEEYVKKVNSILYKGYPIYNVKYFPWDEAGQTFQISFPQMGSSCPTTQKTAEMYKKLHKK